MDVASFVNFCKLWRQGVDLMQEKPDAADGPVGDRIRVKRLSLGIRQADLAKAVGISAPYLNLIEHGRRRIAGRLLRDLAQALGVEPAHLTQSAETSVIAALRQAAVAPFAGAIQTEPAEQFAGRFPGWAALMIQAAEHGGALEQRVAALSDRVMHDPQLADALHDVLDAVTAIRSTATILAEEQDIDPSWRNRFTRNVFEDATRLSNTAQGVVEYLRTGSAHAGSQAISDLDRVNVVMRQMGYDFQLLDDKGPSAVADLVNQADLQDHPAARQLLQAHLMQLAQDAVALPYQRLQGVTADAQSIMDFQAQHAVPWDRLMRRLAFAPARADAPMFGYVACDISGGFMPRKDTDLLQLPRAGAGCAMLPLYQSFLQPMRPLQMSIANISAPMQRIETLSFAAYDGPVRPGAPAQLRAHMLYWADHGAANADTLRVGMSCRLCPAPDCPARRITSPLAGA